MRHRWVGNEGRRVYVEAKVVVQTLTPLGGLCWSPALAEAGINLFCLFVGR